MSTQRLYYSNSFLWNFVASVTQTGADSDGQSSLVLDRTAFYPASGGQPFDTGWLEVWNPGGAPPKLRVIEVREREDGELEHLLEGSDPLLQPGVKVRGFVDGERRRDHMQQHSGQHLLSAAFLTLFGMPTVSFHLGQESCTIDLETSKLTAEQVHRAEELANGIVLEDRPLEIRYATIEEARQMGVRKIPDAEHDKLRLIEIKDFDLNACGGTHVRSTGQIGAILLRKTEKVKQGWRVEFVCGSRAVRVSRHEYETLTGSAALFSAHPDDLPVQIRKLIEDSKSAAKREHHLLEEVASLMAGQVLAGLPQAGGAVTLYFAERDLGFIKLLAQRLTRQGTVTALLGCGGPQPSVVFAQTPGLPHDMNGLMKEALAELGGRGGGNKDLAQGGVADGTKIEAVLARIAQNLE